MNDKTTLAGYIGGTALIGYIMACVALFIGYVINFFSVVIPPYPVTFSVQFALEVMGIFFPPLGGVMGWI